MLQHEHQHWNKGILRLAGVDEAGRGPLAGPVVAGAVFIDRAFLEREEHGLLSKLTDSKKISESRREYFLSLFTESPFIEVGIGFASVEEIDCINILNATHLAMHRAVENLPKLPDLVLVDGLPVDGFPCDSVSIVKGDSKSLLIAAGSIVAKVTRDRYMKEQDLLYPQYGFSKHKGYGTRGHMEALRMFGPVSIHRRSFKPVKYAESMHRINAGA